MVNALSNRSNQTAAIVVCKIAIWHLLWWIYWYQSTDETAINTSHWVSLWLTLVFTASSCCSYQLCSNEAPFGCQSQSITGGIDMLLRLNVWNGAMGRLGGVPSTSISPSRHRSAPSLPRAALWFLADGGGRCNLSTRSETAFLDGGPR